MRNLKKGQEANSLTILVESIDIKPYSVMKRGLIDDGIILKFGRYDIDSVLIQMLEDYGEDELIKKIESLK